MAAVVQQIIEFLSEHSPFDELQKDLVNDIAQSSHLIYLTQENSAGLLRDHANCLYLIQNGQFAIKDSGEPIKHLSDGDYFGFPSLLDSVDYGLSVGVDSPGIVLCIQEQFFKTAMEEERFKQFFEAINGDSLQNKAVTDTNSMWLYKPLFEVVQNSPIYVSPTTNVRAAAQLMTEKNVSSVLVMRNDDLLGIVTDRDLRKRVLAQGYSADAPVDKIMTLSPVHLTKNKTIFDAICKMNEYGINHLPILDARTGKPFGMITNTDISRQQRTNVVFVISDLSKCANVDELATSARQVPQYIMSNAKRAGDFDIAGKVLAQATDIMTRKLINFYQQEHGKAPMYFCWLVFGSQAREDQTMGSDQDNALLLAQEPTPKQDAYFEDLAKYVCEGLGKCGIKLCDGNIMASNPKLRKSLNAYEKESLRWVNNPTSEAILDFNIFLDVRAVAGDAELLNKLQKSRTPLFQKSLFLAALARSANEASVPLSMFQKFVYAKGQAHKESIDIKKSAVLIINNIVRLYALASGVTAANTVARLNNLPSTSGLSPRDRQNLRDIWILMNRLRWRHQLTNNVDDNHVRISDLSSIERHQLKASFQAIHRAQQAVVLKFSGGIG
jgi:CBS domain-containing protein